MDELARQHLVRWVEEGEEIAHGDRLDAVRDEGLSRALDGRLVERDEDRAVGGDPLAHLLAQGAGNEEDRRLGLEDEVVHGAPFLATDLEHVLEAGRGEEADLGPLGLEHRVGRDRGAVDEASDRARVDLPGGSHEVDGGLDPRARVMARRRNLDQAQGALRVAAHHVREGAADVDADLETVRHVPALLAPRPTFTPSPNCG